MDLGTTDLHVPEHVGATLTDFIARCRQDPSLELEARLGRCVNGRFVPGVDRAYMHALVKSLDDTTNVASHSEGRWDEVEDFLFQHRGQRLRTRVSFADGEVRPQSVCKTVLSSLTLMTHRWDVRVSLSRETTVPNQDLPSVCRTDHVRIKQMRAFEVTTSPFRMDCAMVWSGSVRSEAEQRQTSENPTFEVECEFVPFRREGASSGATAEAWTERYPDTASGNLRLAGSFMLKITDLLMVACVKYNSKGCCERVNCL
jgi:hypothetical protein